MTADKNHLRGLRAALDWQPSRPELPTFEEFKTWPPDKQAEFDDDRTSFVLDGLRIGLPHVSAAIRETKLLIHTNNRMSGGRAPLVMDAPSTSGKTETAMACAREVELTVSRRNPNYRKDGDVPVAWCEVPSGATGKSLARAIYSFFTKGFEPPNSWSNDTYISRVVDLLETHNTKLLVLDEAHNISARAGMGQGEASDNIKEILNRTTTTVLMAGVDLEIRGILTAQRAAQLTKRATWIPFELAAMNTKEAKERWKKTCRAFEQQLPLMGHKPGLLSTNSELLQKATEGHIGPLAQLVQRIFLDIIEDRERDHEQITPQVLRDTLRDWTRVKKDINTSGAEIRDSDGVIHRTNKREELSHVA